MLRYCDIKSVNKCTYVPTYVLFNYAWYWLTFSVVWYIWNILRWNYNPRPNIWWTIIVYVVSAPLITVEEFRHLIVELQFDPALNPDNPVNVLHIRSQTIHSHPQSFTRDTDIRSLGNCFCPILWYKTYGWSRFILVSNLKFKKKQMAYFHLKIKQNFYLLID